MKHQRPKRYSVTEEARSAVRTLAKVRNMTVLDAVAVSWILSPSCRKPTGALVSRGESVSESIPISIADEVKVCPPADRSRVLISGSRAALTLSLSQLKGALAGSYSSGKTSKARTPKSYSRILREGSSWAGNAS